MMMKRRVLSPLNPQQSVIQYTASKEVPFSSLFNSNPLPFLPLSEKTSEALVNYLVDKRHLIPQRFLPQHSGEGMYISSQRHSSSR